MNARRHLFSLLCLTAFLVPTTHAAQAATCATGEVLFSEDSGKTGCSPKIYIDPNPASALVIPGFVELQSQANIQGDVMIGQGASSLLIRQFPPQGVKAAAHFVSIGNPYSGGKSSLPSTIQFDDQGVIDVRVKGIQTLSMSGDGEHPGATVFAGTVIMGGTSSPQLIVGGLLDAGTISSRNSITAQHFVIQNHGTTTVLSMPPVCLGPHKALQFDGVSYICQTM